MNMTPRNLFATIALVAAAGLGAITTYAQQQSKIPQQPRPQVQAVQLTDQQSVMVMQLAVQNVENARLRLQVIVQQILAQPEHQAAGWKYDFDQNTFYVEVNPAAAAKAGSAAGPIPSGAVNGAPKADVVQHPHAAPAPAPVAPPPAAKK